MDSRQTLEWFRFGDMDLNAANHLLSLHPAPLEIICFHCQQAAEKYLKAYLICTGPEQPPKIHDLRKLHQLCFNSDEQFDLIADACEALTIYGVQPRYPEEIYLEDHHMRKALDYAGQIQAFAPLQELRSKLEEEA
ncbi:MAG: HEPN domain-containing protein [Clostridiales bacterium]|nr:HEPN domain-containing protein [Clostridiales bacterium]